jgi:HlyD family secretion protein
MVKRFRGLSSRGKAVVIVAVLLAGSGVLFGAVRLGRRGPTVPTAAVTRGEFLDSMQFHGEVKALKSLTISAPSGVGDMQIVKIVPEGTQVKAGDVVVEFDRTKTEQDLAQYQSSLKSAEAEIGQANAQARLAEEEDKTAVFESTLRRRVGKA